MHDPLTTARERARHWREAQEDAPAGGVVLLFDGHFLGWLPQLPPAEQWAPGCLAIEDDGHAYLIDQRGWREPLQWFDLDPPPSPPESLDDPEPVTES
jgi:hypothetical protein